MSSTRRGVSRVRTAMSTPPYQIMAKAVGSACNMRCDYCYYLEKGADASGAFAEAHSSLMSDEVLEAYVQNYILSQPLGSTINFTWHGGEALLRPRSFYLKALALQERYGTGYHIENALQTNGLAMTEAWAQFFREHNFLVGLSLDGTERQHDRYRRTIGGAGSFKHVMRALEILQRIGAEYNILSTINSFNADDPLEYYQFLKGIGVRYIQFTPIVERMAQGQARYTHIEAPKPLEAVKERLSYRGQGIELAPYSVRPRQWGDFLCEVFDEWVRTDVGGIFVQMFDSTLAGWMGVPPGVCTLAPRCGHAGVIEHNGDVYGCDHYVYPDYRLGNILEHDLGEMMHSAQQRHFGALKELALTEQCRTCTYRFACNGECPKNRFALSHSGEPGHNYLCTGYYQYFEHVAPYMDEMRRLLLQGQPPSLVMQTMGQ